MLPPADNARLSSLLQQTLWTLGFGNHHPEQPATRLASFVRHHGVAGLIDATRLASLPDACQEALAQEKRHTTLRALQLAATLKRLFSALHSAQLTPVALKGPALAVQAHGSLGTRSSVDLDILINEAQWPQALAVLHEQGYTPLPGQSLPLPAGTHELVLTHRSGLPRVELHRRLLRHRDLLANLQGNSVPLDILATPIHCLPPTYAVPYLVAHANQHCFRRLIWLIDIHALLQHPDFDPREAADIFVRSGTCGSLDACLSLLTLLFGSFVAEQLQAVRRPCQASKRMVDLALQGIEQSLSDKALALNQGTAKRVLMDLALLDNLPARLHAIGDWLSPTNADLQWTRLPTRLNLLYPLLRLCRLVFGTR